LFAEVAEVQQNPKPKKKLIFLSPFLFLFFFLSFSLSLSFCAAMRLLCPVLSETGSEQKA
jgi:hypothetical protein